MTAETKTRVFLVDDHPLVREWLTTLVNQQEDMIICGDAADAGQARRMIAALTPDIAVVDISLEDQSGLELIKDIKELQPGLAILVLSMHDEMLYAERALRAGARGYIMKREATKKVVAAIRTLLAGQLWVSEPVSQKLAEKFIEGAPAIAEPLTARLSDRELQVFRLIGQGHSTRQIAESMHISTKTVQAFQARIKDKLALHNAAELQREAIYWAERHP